MAKVSRSMLKSIVKECLVELLAEGLSGGDTESLAESIEKRPRKSIPSEPQSDVYSNFNKQMKVNASFEEKTKQAISNATSDPVMASLLEDTAKTTLQEQNTADRPNQFTAKPTDAYSQAVSESDPMEMFGGASNNWAALAFSDK